MNKTIKSNKGITLISLSVTIAVMIILSFTISINANKYIELKKYKNFENDMTKLTEEISHYYSENKNLPIANKFVNEEVTNKFDKDPNDNENYFIIDIDKLSNIKLNYGKGFYDIKDKTIDISDILNLFIINEQSHMIYYPDGIAYNENIIYTTLNKGNNVNIPKFCNVKFDTNIEKYKLDDKLYEIGKEFGVLPEIKMNYYELIGWYDSPKDGNEIKNDSIVPNNNEITLYAYWEQVKPPIIEGGADTEENLEWSEGKATINVFKSGEAYSKIDFYEYYIATTSELPTLETKANGKTLNSVEISTNGLSYVYFRTVSKNGVISQWSNVQIVKVGSTHVLNNLIINGSFENESTGWSLSNCQIVNTGYHGNSSIRFNHNNGEDFTAMLTQSLSISAPTLGHKYYGSLMFKSSKTFDFGELNDCRYDWFYSDEVNGHMTFASKKDKTDTWMRKSQIQTIDTDVYLNQNWIIRNLQRGAKEYSYADAIMLIDLTECFGNGNEPDLAWCDENIEYFEGTTTIFK